MGTKHKMNRNIPLAPCDMSQGGPHSTSAVCVSPALGPTEAQSEPTPPPSHGTLSFFNIKKIATALSEHVRVTGGLLSYFPGEEVFSGRLRDMPNLDDGNTGQAFTSWGVLPFQAPPISSTPQSLCFCYFSLPLATFVSYCCCNKLRLIGWPITTHTLILSPFSRPELEISVPGCNRGAGSARLPPEALGENPCSCLFQHPQLHPTPLAPGCSLVFRASRVASPLILPPFLPTQGLFSLLQSPLLPFLPSPSFSSSLPPSNLPLPLS